jgi:hypothetical protein
MLRLSRDTEEHQLLLSSLIVEKRRVVVAKEKENLEGNTLQTDLRTIQTRKTQLDDEVASIKAVQREQAVVLEAKQAEVARLSARNREVTEELHKSLGFYRKFGLDFEKRADRWLKLTFTLVDPHNHGREFSFMLFINARDQYEVQDCSPAVQALPAMLATLNTTNDFSAFIIGMRRQFQAMV